MEPAPFDDFIQQCWADHAEHAAAVAERLRGGAPEPATAAQLAALLRLAVHVCAEHLGDFDGARAHLARLAAHLLADAALDSALRVARHSLAMAETGAGEAAARSVELSDEERIRAEAGAAAIALGRQDTARAMALLAAARERLAARPDAGAAVHRPLAVACNNMAWALYDRAGARGENDTAAMLELAAASRLHWSRAGTWLEVERADYGLALCHLAAGRADEALAHAERCMRACTEHGAPPYEHFHAHEALARVHRARGDEPALLAHIAGAARAFEALAPEDRPACAATLEAVRALAR